MVAARFYIKEYLQKRGGEVAGGDIERDVSSFTLYKPSYLARVLRKMAQEGKLSTTYRKAPTGREYVVYRLNS